MGFDNAYEAITEQADDHRWAFGTGFHDPLAGVDTAVPDGVDGADLAAYCLMLGDDALVMSHRLQQWLTRAPELEEETALANIGLDLLGQVRLLFTRAGKADGSGRDEDEFAFFRDTSEFRNVQLVEEVNSDFGALVTRLVVFSTWRLAVFELLRESRDPVLAAIADMGVKELAYHRDYAARWVVRLGDGTAFSRQRIEDGMLSVAPGLDALFRATDLERRLHDAGVAIDPGQTRSEFDGVVGDVLAVLGLRWPTVTSAEGCPGRDGVHTAAMDELVSELQSVARAHRGATW